MYTFIYNNTKLDEFNIKYPTKKPKYRINDKVTLIEGSIDIHCNYSKFLITDDDIVIFNRIIRDNIVLTIHCIAIDFDTNNIVYFTKEFPGFVISEPCFGVSFHKIYNNKNRNVYEHIDNYEEFKNKLI